MRKLFTAKPGRPASAPQLPKPRGKSSTGSASKATGLFLLLGIVALQWSFTTAVTGENHTANLITDTSTTPVTGTAIVTPKKPASTRSNRTVTSSKPALAANLERETISFGSPTGGPDTESGIPKINNKKTVVTGSTKATGVKTADTKNADVKTTDVKTKKNARY